MEDAAAAPYSAPKQITYENTYITDPEGYGEVRTMLCAPVSTSFASSSGLRPGVSAFAAIRVQEA